MLRAICVCWRGHSYPRCRICNRCNKKPYVTAHLSIEIPVGVPRRQGTENFNHVALLVQRREVCYVAAAIISGILDCKRSALGIVGEDHDLGGAVCASMLFLALKIFLNAVSCTKNFSDLVLPKVLQAAEM